MKERVEFAVVSFAVMTLVSEIRTVEIGGLDLRPKYQRNFIWNNKFKDELIYSIIKNYPIGSIIMRILKEPNEKGAKAEIVDGQQRLTTILEFVEEEYEIHSEVSRKIIEEIIESYGDRKEAEFERLKKRLNNKGKIKLKYSDLPSIVKGRFEAFNISVTKILEASEADVTEYFRYLQNQERLRAGEILHSLSDSKMDRYLRQIEDLESFCEIIGFNNIRQEFDKIFYNVIGLFDNKVSLGTPDNIIKKYVTTVDEITEGKKEVERLLEQINQITKQYKDRKILKGIKKRYIKFLMLLMGFDLVDFTVHTEEKLKILEQLDNKMSVFFSSKPEVVKNEFKNYSNEVIEEFRSIALISKGAQILARVKNRMEILGYYIENFEEKQQPSKVSMT